MSLIQCHPVGPCKSLINNLVDTPLLENGSSGDRSRGAAKYRLNADYSFQKRRLQLEEDGGQPGARGLIV